MTLQVTRLCPLLTAPAPRESLYDYIDRLELIRCSSHQYSRGELRALPLHRIAYGRPQLSFPTVKAGSDAGAIHREIEQLIVQYRRFKAVRSLKQLKFTQLRIRRAWARMVELADGTLIQGGRWPSTMVFRAD